MRKKSILPICWACVLVAGLAVCAAQTESSGNSAVATAAAVAPGNTSSLAPATSTSSPAPQFQQRDPRYKISTSDTFDLTFPLTPELNQLGVAVQPDGFVALSGINDVKVAGLTVPELNDKLRQAYGAILRDPVISIVLKDFNKPYFIVDGQVGHPGKYDLRGETTLTEAIAIAGGFTETSKHSQVLLLRPVSDALVSTRVIDVKKMQAKGDMREDPNLHPGDKIFVPKNKISKIKAFLPNSSLGAYVPIN